LTGIKELTEQANKFHFDVKEKNRKHCRFFKEGNVLTMNLCDKSVLKKVQTLWDDEAIQDALVACRNYQIQVSQLDYLMENLNRIIANDYIPQNDDIVRSRQRTAGAHVTRFSNDKFNYEIIDCGGQKPERAKWINIVQEGFTTIIYFASLDEYNMESSEVTGKTKMEVSMEVFRDIVNDPENYKPFMILFLTKKDLFKTKIQSKKGKKEFDEKFPDFKKFILEEKEREEREEKKEEKKRERERCRKRKNYRKKR